jgi:hypothetical protein
MSTTKKSKALKQMVHYVCENVDDPSKLGATKLNKVLWYADTTSFRLSGKTISGENAYLKQKFGPVPKNILNALDELEEQGVIRIKQVPFFGKKKREFISLTPFDSSIFDQFQKEILDFAIEHVCDHHTAVSISNETHDIIWEAAELGEEIPVYAVLASTPGEVTKSHTDWADKILKKLHPKRTTTKRKREEQIA